MDSMRRFAVPAVAVLLLASCGGASSHQAATTTTVATTPVSAPSFATARARTTGAGPVDFKQLIEAHVGGGTVTAEENGTVSFTERRAHLYKQIPGSPVPEELVLLGPFIYANANIQAALSDPSVKPWTKLDTRRLTAKQRRTRPDELAHVVAPVYLADGVAAPRRSGREANGTTRFTGVVDPARLARRVPPSIRTSIATAVANDYAAKPFPATFWLDDQGRIRRVRVDYRTPQGSRIIIDTSYSGFGSKIDVTLPAAGDIADVSP